MLRALFIAGLALRVWWREVYLLTFFNLAWLVLQLPIVTGPPATAAMYAIARRIADDELLTPRHGWDALRHMFLPAWKWGAVNLAIVIVTVFNFWAYQNATGPGWTVLRLAWATIALGWFAGNLFYWPFWLAQDDRSMRTTWRNSFLFVAKRPGLALTLTLLSAVLIAASLATTLPLATLLMAWLALLGVLAVNEELRRDPIASRYVRPVDPV
jgi:uncharacterized membrane protein YesL